MCRVFYVKFHFFNIKIVCAVFFFFFISFFSSLLLFIIIFFSFFSLFYFHFVCLFSFSRTNIVIVIFIYFVIFGSFACFYELIRSHIHTIFITSFVVVAFFAQFKWFYCLNSSTLWRVCVCIAIEIGIACVICSNNKQNHERYMAKSEQINNAILCMSMYVYQSVSRQANLF